MKEMEKEFYQRAGSYLKSRIKQSKVKMIELAPKIGVHQSYLSKTTLGGKISLYHFVNALRAMGVKQIDLAELYGDAPVTSVVEAVERHKANEEKVKLKQMLREVLAESLVDGEK